MSGKTGASRYSLLLHAAGLVSIYSLYGFLQEKIMKNSTYGPNEEHFTSSSILIVFNRLFSIAVGVAILFYKSRRQPEHGVFTYRLKPASPYFAYASVAVFNFLSTSCQYQALRYVSYTTQSLAKTSKMVPVLVVGALVWKQKHATKSWVAAGVILAGCATYLFSSPPTPHGSHAAAAPSDDHTDLINGLAGTFFLVGYLFFDGLVSTTQEKVFGKNPASSDPFGPESPVLDQMVWTNVFACIIAILASLASTATGGFWNNLELLLASAPLLWDVCVFSAASAVGLIILLNTIASFGALTSSLIMTIRQFLSILINAGLFGNFASVSVVGWTGVFWVASGIWIKINKRYDPPKEPKSAFDLSSSEHQSMLSEKGSPAGTPLLGSAFDRPLEQPNKVQRTFLQYVVPCLAAVLAASLLSPFMGPLGDGSALSIVADAPAANLTAAFSVVDASFDDLDEPLAALSGISDLADTTADVDAQEAEDLAVAIEGGSWDSQLHEAISPACKSDLVTHLYETDLRTGFVSFPRSGNSYLRSLIERATGYQTSSVYCDLVLVQKFAGECDHQQNFFIKTHWPALDDMPGMEKYYREFDQVVHVIRNPLDAIISWWHYDNAPRTEEGWQNHEAKVDVELFGEPHRFALMYYADRWARHTTYWTDAPILTHTLRYENLKAQPIPNMMSLLSFLLPDEDLPPLQDVACIAEHHENLQAYHSRRSSDFATWDKFDPVLRDDILKVVRRPFCALGYRRVLLNARPDDATAQAAMDRFCEEEDVAEEGKKPAEEEVEETAAETLEVEEAVLEDGAVLGDDREEEEEEEEESKPIEEPARRTGPERLRRM
ncbi:hypothetical protein JCM6882_002748 [Rhodosporidiobolus microsporus]